MELSAAGFAYPGHDGSTRAGLARRLLHGSGRQHGFVLSTCLRVEVVVPGSQSDLEATLHSLFGELAATANPEIRVGEGAVHHLYRIAAGLESPILGEQEILTQFRQALIAAEESLQVGGVFARLLETAVATGRQARELLPGSPHNSMAAVAAQVVGAADRVAVLGSGTIATAVIDGLMLLPAPPDVTVVVRNPEKLADRPDIEVVSFSGAGDVLSTFPAVISATSAKHRLVEDDALEGILAEREIPLLLVDMAMPPDFSPPDRAPVTYLNIDDLARMADRRARSEEADELVAAAASDAYRTYRDHHEIGPLIAGLVSKADEAVESAVQRFSGRLRDTEDGPVLDQAVHTAVRSLLAAPIVYLKNGGRSDQAVQVIAEAFGIDDE